MFCLHSVFYPQQPKLKIRLFYIKGLNFFNLDTSKTFIFRAIGRYAKLSNVFK